MSAAPSSLAAGAGPDGPETASPSWRFWLLYAGGWLLLGFALALADAQDPRVVPGRRIWEPFVLEMGSVVVVGALTILVYRWVWWLERTDAGPARLALAHVAGAGAFVLLHVGITYASRIALYAALGLDYRMRPWPAVLAFEAPKDLVTYALMAGLAMAYRLHLREQAQRLLVERARGELAELRLARLGDQLHPHFLFNCLNSIAALVEENPRAAVSMIARVGDFLRSSLRSDRPWSTLGEEIDLAERYLEIQRIRFEGALVSTATVAPGLAATPVPRLLLQPIVENAVKHTMARPGSPVALRIEASVEGESVRIEVANSRPDAPPPADGTGRGLALVRERLVASRGDLSLAGSFGDPREARGSLRGVDLVFLDVEMPFEDGFSLLESLPEAGRPCVIFATAHERHALRAIRYDAIDFLLKPYDERDFDAAVARARRRLEAREAERATGLPFPSFLGVRVRDGEGQRILPPEIIDWVRAEGRSVLVASGGRVMHAAGPLGDLESRLAPHGFLRVHRSCLVNVSRVRAVLPRSHGDRTLVLEDGQRVAMSRHYAARFDALTR